MIAIHTVAYARASQRSANQGTRQRSVSLAMLASVCLAAALCSCGVDSGPKHDPKRPTKQFSWVAANSRPGHLRDAAWIRAQKIYGVSLGMSMDEAVSILAQRGDVQRASAKIDEQLPWTFLYAIGSLRTEGLPVSDLAWLRKGPASSSREPSLRLFGTNVRGQVMLTGIELSTTGGRVDAAALGPATESYDATLGGLVVPTYIFAAERGFADPTRTKAMEFCAGARKGDSSFDVTEPMRVTKCSTAQAPKSEYLLVWRDLSSRVDYLELRDPTNTTVYPKAR
jgi:hypothetical protein